ncbi:hypothetical protein B0T19DRAFT_468501 [Cercophora scortea]|uniref:DUF7708 domain-containing protein n=1 Tax=Cercophora scortea TaxID=314031 RepID=A0AAE0I8W5_9PEZI|nr:hypothetical protein B0T19DRAFT_468501 [Cercophora scortea]
MAQYIANNGRLPSPVPPEPLHPSQTLHSFVLEFSSGMHVFLERTKDDEATRAFSQSTWKDLQDEAAQARQALEAIDRAGGSVARRLQFLLELIPDGEYTSVLSGGLRLAYNTAKRKEEVRSKILQTLESLSDTAWHSTAGIKLYSHGVELKTRSEELYMAILDFVRHCTKYLDKSRALDSFKAFFRQSRYGTEFDDAADNIGVKATAFDKCVTFCFQRRVEIVDYNVKWIQTPLTAIYFLLAGVAKDHEYFRRYHLELLAKAANPTIQYIQAPVMQPVISSQEIRHLLSTSWRSGNNTMTDLSLILKQDAQAALRNVPSYHNQEQIGLIMQDPRFTTWLRALNSQFIIVHDEKSLQDISALSTMSYLCALMSQMLSSPGMFCLTFFCGLHTRATEDTLDGSRGIIQSFILQLLAAFGETSFLIQGGFDKNTLLQGLMMDDLGSMFSVFSLLLENIQAGVVYCFVDGASWYHTDARSNEMKAVVHFLAGLVDQVQLANRGLVLKVLVTNPTPRQRYNWEVAVVDIHLEKQLLTGGHGGDEAQRIAAMRAGAVPHQ